MGLSPLATYVNLTDNFTRMSGKVNDTITIHVFVGQVTAKRGIDYFTTSKNSSAQYVVGWDGSIGGGVDEKHRAWTSGGGLTVNGETGSQNDRHAITIEVASDTVHPYAITDAAMEALIKLLADICQRHGKRRLVWISDKFKAVAYKPAADEMKLTAHRWFAAKACPGDYLYTRFGQIAERVNQILEDEEMTPEKFDELLAGSKVLERMVDAAVTKQRQALQDNDCGPWSEAAREFVINEGIFNGSGRLPDGEINYMWQDMLTREQAAQLIYNLAIKYGLVKPAPAEE